MLCVTRIKLESWCCPVRQGCCRVDIPRSWLFLLYSKCSSLLSKLECLIVPGSGSSLHVAGTQWPWTQSRILPRASVEPRSGPPLTAAMVAQGQRVNPGLCLGSLQLALDFDASWLPRASWESPMQTSPAIPDCWPLTVFPVPGSPAQTVTNEFLGVSRNTASYPEIASHGHTSVLTSLSFSWAEKF